MRETDIPALLRKAPMPPDKKRDYWVPLASGLVNAFGKVGLRHVIPSRIVGNGLFEAKTTWLAAKLNAAHEQISAVTSELPDRPRNHLCIDVSA